MAGDVMELSKEEVATSLGIEAALPIITCLTSTATATVTQSETQSQTQSQTQCNCKAY